MHNDNEVSPTKEQNREPFICDSVARKSTKMINPEIDGALSELPDLQPSDPRASRACSDSEYRPSLLVMGVELGGERCMRVT